MNPTNTQPRPKVFLAWNAYEDQAFVWYRGAPYKTTAEIWLPASEAEQLCRDLEESFQAEIILV